MQTRRMTLCLVTLSFIVGFGMTTPIFAQSHYYYFKEERPLTLDVNRVIVFQSATKRDRNLPQGDDQKARDAIATAIARAGAVGLDATEVTASAISGRFFVGTAAEHKSKDAVHTTIRRMSDKSGADFISPVFLDGRGEPLAITPHLLVGFDRNITADRAEAILAELKVGTIVDRDWANMKRTYRLRSTSRNGFDVLDAANTLAQHPDVKFAEPDMMITGHHSLIPNDPGFGSCWGIHNTAQFGGIADMDMDGPEAWDITTGDPSVIVVIIDTGVQQNHPDINQIGGTDTTTDPSSTGNGDPVNACDNHGTAVAGCVSATINNNLGTVGIAPGVVSASARSFISTLDCSGSWNADFGWTVMTLAWAESIGAKVTNNSNIYSYGNASAAVTQKYEDTYNNGMIHFGSAHNDGIEAISYPANLPTVNAVAALDPDGTLTNFSNWGDGLAFSAPGIGVYTTDRTGTAGWTGDDYVFAQGTSFASPYTAGVAALVRSEFPNLTPPEVELAMQQGAVDLGDPGHDKFFGHGFVNAHGSLLAAVPPDPCETQKLTASDADLGDLFGNAVAMSGDTLTIGAFNESNTSGGFDGSGAVYVFGRSGVDWSELQILTSSDLTTDDEFGGRISVDNTTMVVGAFQHSHVHSRAGAAYVFEEVSGTWLESVELNAFDAAPDDFFGADVGVSGNTVVVGAINDGGDASGGAYVFEEPLGTWNSVVPPLTVAKKLTLPLSVGPGDRFGKCVDLDGDTCVVCGDHAGSGGPGECFVFGRDVGGSGNWGKIADLNASDASAADRFGNSCAICGDIIVVGAFFDDDGGDASGSAYIYTKDQGGLNNWGEVKKVTASDATPGAWYGVSIACEADRIIVGARGMGAGAAYSYERNAGGVDNWGEVAKLSTSDGVSGDDFGVSVAVKGGFAVIGALRDDCNAGSECGSAYAFAIGGDCDLNGEIDLCEIKDDPSLDLDNNGVLDVCDCPVDPPEPEPVLVEKNRYITIVPNNPGIDTALRVTFTDLDRDYSIWNGMTMWVTDPRAVTEQSGSNDDTPPTFTAATLSCQQDCQDWGALGAIDIFAEGIAPGSSFEVQAIKCLPQCKGIEANFSDPLPLTTSRYGDAVGQFDNGTCSWTPPNGIVSIPFDTVAIIEKFQNKPCSARKVRADLIGVPPNSACVDQKVNVTDYVQTIGAFQGAIYPFSPTAADPCNALPCPNP